MNKSGIVLLICNHRVHYFANNPILISNTLRASFFLSFFLFVCCISRSRRLNGSVHGIAPSSWQGRRNSSAITQNVRPSIKTLSVSLSPLYACMTMPPFRVIFFPTFSLRKRHETNEIEKALSQSRTEYFLLYLCFRFDFGGFRNSKRDTWQGTTIIREEKTSLSQRNETKF